MSGVNDKNYQRESEKNSISFQILLSKTDVLISSNHKSSADGLISLISNTTARRYKPSAKKIEEKVCGHLLTSRQVFFDFSPYKISGVILENLTSKLQFGWMDYKTYRKINQVNLAQRTRWEVPNNGKNSSRRTFRECFTNGKNPSRSLYQKEEFIFLSDDLKISSAAHFSFES